MISVYKHTPCNNIRYYKRNKKLNHAYWVYKTLAHIGIVHFCTLDLKVFNCKTQQKREYSHMCIAETDTEKTKVHM